MSRRRTSEDALYTIDVTPTMQVFMSLAGGVTLLAKWPNGHPHAIEHYSLEGFQTALKTIATERPA